MTTAVRSQGLIYGNQTSWREAARLRAEAEAILRARPDDVAAHYALSRVAEFSGDMGAAVHHLEHTGLHIGADFDDLELAQHQELGTNYITWTSRPHPLSARFIVSMPKSASAFVAAVWHNLGHLARVRVSKGSFGCGRVVPSWLHNFNCHGGVLHDHFPLSEPNKAALLADPPRRILVLVREPVAATLSLFEFVMQLQLDKFAARELGEVDLSYLRRLPAADARAAFFQKAFPVLAMWIEGWLAFSSERPGGMAIATVQFEHAIQDMPLVVEAMATFFDGRPGAFSAQGDMRNRVEEEFSKFRSRDETTVTPHFGRRDISLASAEQEVVWRIAQRVRFLPELYDLTRHLH